jgi:hypothetical protein
MYKSILSLSLFALLISCSSDDDNNIITPSLDVPDAYSFERDGSSTVSFSGQTQRIMMGDELKVALLDNTKTADQLQSMYAHQEGDADFSDPMLNASSKNLRSKTAASMDYFFANSTESNQIKNQIETWLANQANDVFTNWNTSAQIGQAGQIQEAGGGSIRWVNEKGLEYDQSVVLTLFGAVMTDQMLNNYLSPAVLDEGNNIANNNDGITEDASNYTTMEHKWDEAFGYLYGTDNPTNPQLGQDSYLNKYLGRVENDSDFSGIATEIYDAFILGRAAIVANDYELRDQQAEIIKEKISKIIGIRAVYYLQQAKSGFPNDLGAAFHDLSEAYGFINSLQFTRMPNSDSPYFSKSEVGVMLATMMEGDGFWDITEDTLDDFSNQISERFNFTTAEAAN